MSDNGERTDKIDATPSKAIKRLVLDAAPLLTQAPIRDLAEEFYTTPQVIAELRDEKSRKYLEMLEIQGIHINVQQADPVSYAKGLINFSLSIKLTTVQFLAFLNLQVITAFSQDQIWAFSPSHMRLKYKRMVQKD